MAQRSRVPKFGTWESEGNVPYTAYFDKAREGRNGGGKIVNPNDPQESPQLHPEYAAPTRAAAASRPRPESDADSPAGAENGNRRGRGVSPGEAPKRATRASIGSENSIDKSPLHHQARGAARSSMVSPAWESSHGTPGRSKMRPPAARGNESPDKGAAVPKFGDWDEKNPASADGYTHIFNLVREERNNGGNATPGERSPYNNTPRNRKSTNGHAKGCCFPFWRK